jgi:hypothetical protein
MIGSMFRTIFHNCASTNHHLNYQNHSNNTFLLCSYFALFSCKDICVIRRHLRVQGLHRMYEYRDNDMKHSDLDDFKTI